MFAPDHVLPFDSRVPRAADAVDEVPRPPIDHEYALCAFGRGFVPLAGRSEPVEPPASLAMHVSECAMARGRWFGVRSVVDRLDAITRPRLVSTGLALVTVAIGIVWSVG